jgi:hypothetical protein
VLSTRLLRRRLGMQSMPYVLTSCHEVVVNQSVGGESSLLSNYSSLRRYIFAGVREMVALCIAEKRNPSTSGSRRADRSREQTDRASLVSQIVVNRQVVVFSLIDAKFDVKQ